jgi:hypothetical protein
VGPDVGVDTVPVVEAVADESGAGVAAVTAVSVTLVLLTALSLIEHAASNANIGTTPAIRFTRYVSSIVAAKSIVPPASPCHSETVNYGASTESRCPESLTMSRFADSLAIVY